MSQQELTAAVAAATGESRRQIREMGFSLADPLAVDYDPEPCLGHGYLDWDEIERGRSVRWIE